MVGCGDGSVLELYRDGVGGTVDVDDRSNGVYREGVGIGVDGTVGVDGCGGNTSMTGCGMTETTAWDSGNNIMKAPRRWRPLSDISSLRSERGRCGDHSTRQRRAPFSPTTTVDDLPVPGRGPQGPIRPYPPHPPTSTYLPGAAAAGRAFATVCDTGFSPL